MEKNVTFNHLFKEFDTFVQTSFENNEKQLKNTQLSSKEGQNKDMMNTYWNNLSKKLKIAPNQQDQKFKNICKPFAGMKTFVNMKDFMNKVSTKVFIEKKQSKIEEEINVKEKYQRARGGFYLEKVENHLKRNNYKRDLGFETIQILNQNKKTDLDQGEYQRWVQNALTSIGTKQEQFFKHFQRKQTEDSSIKDPQDQTRFLIRKNTAKKIAQENAKQQQQFMDITNALSKRLKKILKNKVSKDQNFATTTPRPQTQQVKKRKPSNANLGLSRSTIAFPKNESISKRQIKTSNFRSRKRIEIQDWKENVNTKINNIIDLADEEFDKNNTKYSFRK